MGNPRKIRGEYRPFYEALFNGKDFNALSPAAKLCMVMIKGLSGTMGIRPWPALAHALAERTGHTAKQCSDAIKQLASSQWIEYEDGIVWLVRGLEFEPQMSPNNSDHRSHFQQFVAGLPTLPITERFKAHYEAYMVPPEPKASKRKADLPAVQAVPQGGVQPVTPPVALHSPSNSSSPSSSNSNSSSPPLPPPVATSGDVSQVLADTMLLTNAANAALDEVYVNRRPWLAGNGRAQQMAADLRHAGIDIEWAAAALFGQARSLKREQPPSSLAFFEQFLHERWHEYQARQGAASYRPAGTVASPAASPEVDQMRSFAIQYARGGNAEWQAYCEERSIAWREVA